LLVYFRLVKAGYGNLDEVRGMNVSDTLQALHYEKFLIDYEAASYEIGKNK
jgi:hypothetical protein